MATKTYCVPCANNDRAGNLATKLAPQTRGENLFAWLPICDHCAEGWFDESEPAETHFPGPVVDLEVVLHGR